MAALVLVIALAACGGQASPKAVRKVAPAPRNVAPTPRKVLLASVRTTAAAPSARVSFRAATSGIGAEQFAVTADGVTDLATGDGQLTMYFTGAASHLFSGGIDVRTVDGATYVQLPESLGKGLPIPGGGKWLKTPDLGAAAGGLPGVDQSDPSQFLAYLEKVSNGVKTVGSETIRGVETTHYQASLDLGRAVDRADVPPSLRDKLRDLLRPRSGSASSIPADVWIDGTGLLRRVELRIDLAAFVGGATGPGAGDTAPIVTISLEMYDFGVPVHVVAPPADQVTTFDLGGSGSSS